MRWKQVEDEPKAFVLIFETGDEIATAPHQFARGQRLAGSNFEAIGALSHASMA
jgi:predicted DNA-binding protein with PD1-like motif